MAIKYTIDDKDYTNIYYINNKKVDSIIYKDPTIIKYYYNIIDDSYNYYSNTISDDSENIVSLSDQIDANIKAPSKEEVNNESIKKYTFKDTDKETVKDSNGKELSINKIDETFIEVKTEDKYIDFNMDITDNKMKDMINDTIDEYKTSEDIVTDIVKEDISKQKDAVKKLREDIEKIKEDNKKKEEEAKRKAEEEAKRKAEEAKKNSTTLTQAQADQIIQKKFGLDSNMTSDDYEMKMSFGSYGLVTYQGDNQKYYYYSAFVNNGINNSYSGSYIVNATTGKVKYVALISRTAPDNGIVPYSSEDKDE